MILRLCKKCATKKETKDFQEGESTCRACKRSSLLKDRPVFRPLELYQGDQYHPDLGLLWVAHQRRPFKLIEADTPEAFAESIEQLSQTFELSIAEDRHKEYEQNGPLALVLTMTDGWSVEPRMEFVPWATRKNILRIAVGYLQMVRYQDYGVCKVSVTSKTDKLLLDHACTYGVLHYVGSIFNGSPEGDEYLYSVSNTKFAKARRTNGIS